jgi:2-methylisocitrate lyase-like PEP mutase family enzyme
VNSKCTICLEGILTILIFRYKISISESEPSLMSRLMEAHKDHPSLRKLLARNEPILAPGAYDAMSALLIERAGFDVVYMTGFGTSASQLGQPDVGLLSMPEMVSNAKRIVQAVNVPVIADGDTGYGNPINVIRTMREYEVAGVSAIQLEDQVAPKKCGHMEGKHVISEEEMAMKISAAVDARESKDFLIIARTDSRAMEGIDSAINRVRAYKEAGADILFVEAPETVEEIKSVGRAFRGTPLLFNWLEGGKTPKVSYDFLKENGFKIVLFPLCTIFAANKAISEVLVSIKKKGTPESVMNRFPAFDKFTKEIGLPRIKQLEKRYKA